MSGYEVRRVTWFELEIMAVGIVFNTIALLVQQVHTFIEFHHVENVVDANAMIDASVPVRSAP